MPKTAKTIVSSEWRGKEVKVKGKAAIGRTAFEVGLIVEGQAKLLCPVKTGRLAASITTASQDDFTVPSGKGAEPSDTIQQPLFWWETFVGTPVFYGPYIEFGTYRSEAQPFLRPSLALAKGETLTIIEKNGRLHFKEFLRAA
tara:strand:+ start:104 stop:532 length:429 start_codon:yes stop_codon:yes gene_type:complete